MAMGMRNLRNNSVGSGCRVVHSGSGGVPASRLAAEPPNGAQRSPAAQPTQETNQMNEETKPKPVISRKRLEANRRNALRSTGPRTARGKNALRWNALRHG